MIRTCLCLITRPASSDEADGTVLLGYKKTGFGAGRWVGLGGHIEEGEKPAAAAVREVAEESSLVVPPDSLSHMASLAFVFPGSAVLGPDCRGLRHLAVFRAAGRVRRGDPALVQPPRTPLRRHVGRRQVLAPDRAQRPAGRRHDHLRRRLRDRQVHRPADRISINIVSRAKFNQCSEPGRSGQRQVRQRRVRARQTGRRSTATGTSG